MLENINIEQLFTNYIVPWSINIAMAVLIFIIGRIITKIIVSLIGKIMRRAKMDEILINFILSIANGLLTLFVIVAAIDRLGVNTTSLVALVGAAGLAIGLALQGSLQNFAAGVMLIVFQPFKNGDFIEAAGVIGSVEKISIFSTILSTPDNKEVIVPNGDIYSGTITNYSAKPTRRVDMEFGIGYEDDIHKARETIQKILDEDTRILSDPAPQILVAALADSSVNFVVRPWVKRADYWLVKCEVTEKVKLAFDANGISIPYPQMDVHINKSNTLA
jgi:small conductance mechanosensitive channel